MRDIFGLIGLFLLCIAFFILLIGACFLQPYMEAKTYNRLTGANVTTWDAIWVKLVVVK